VSRVDGVVRTIVCAFGLCLWLLLDASSVQARAASPAPEPPPGFPSIASEHPLVVEAGRLHVRCGAFDFIGVIASCRVTASLRVRVEHDDVLVVRAEPTDVVLLDGRPLTSTQFVRAGSVLDLHMQGERPLEVSPDAEESPYVLSAAFTRHPVAGEHREMGTASTGTDLSFLAHARLEGVIELDVRDRGVVSVHAGERAIASTAELRAPDALAGLHLSLTRDRTHERPLANGGPYAILGSRLALSDEPEQLVAALGYEVILENAFFASLSIGTDGASLFEALVVEIAAPDPLYILGSFGAGVGAVFRQLGAREADAALRLRLSWQLPMLFGVVADLDWWPSIEEATLTVGARLSL
jgi:hypothetical protein